MSRYRLVTFDLDDTLWAVEPVMRRANELMQSWLAKNAPQLRGVPAEQMKRLREQLLRDRPGIVHDLTELRIAITAAALEHTGVQPDQARDIALRAFEVLIQARNEVTWFDDVEPTFQRLTKRGVVLAGLSNGNADASATGLDRYFAFHINSADVSSSKPAPEMFVAATNKAGVSAADALHVGDNIEHDIVGAQNAGLSAVWINRPQTAAQLPDGAYEIGSLLELERLLD